MKPIKKKKKTYNSKPIKKAIKLGILGALLGTTLYYGKKITTKDIPIKESLEKDIINGKNELDKCKKELSVLEDIEKIEIQKYKDLLKEKTAIAIALSKKIDTALIDLSKLQKGGSYGRSNVSIETQNLMDNLYIIKTNLYKCLIEKRDIKNIYKNILDEILLDIKKQEDKAQRYKASLFLYQNKINELGSKRHL